jgi:hypothetical protein
MNSSRSSAAGHYIAEFDNSAERRVKVARTASFNLDWSSRTGQCSVRPTMVKEFNVAYVHVKSSETVKGR